MEKNLATSLLLLVSFVVITLGGYQCATNVIDLGPGDIQIPISDSSQNGPEGETLNSEELGSLPSEPERSCTRSKYSEIEKYGSKGFMKIDNAVAFEDFVLGETTNYGVRCPRVYLGMRKLKDDSDKNIYKGHLVISYEADGYIRAPVFTSGSSREENQYNEWTGGSWTPDNNNQVSKKFYAIFQHSKRSVILQMDDVRVFNEADGTQVYHGNGKIYFKMFRLWTGDKSDVCYDKGTYVSQARRDSSQESIDLPHKRCWLLGVGPYSCLPNGVLSNFKSQVPKINIQGSLACYQLLGTFGRLNIKSAFNVNEITELP